jgi:hypothetical protein
LALSPDTTYHLRNLLGWRVLLSQARRGPIFSRLLPQAIPTRVAYSALPRGRSLCGRGTSAITSLEGDAFSSRWWLFLAHLFCEGKTRWLKAREAWVIQR